MAQPPAEQVLFRLEASRAALLAAAGELDQDALDAHGGDGAWSAGQVMHHLVLVESAVQAVLSRLADRAPEGPPQAGGQAPVALPADISDAITSRPAFPGTEPTPGLPAARLLRELAESRARTREIAGRAALRDMSHGRFPHPFLGRMDFYQWVLFLAEHETGHVEQVRAILAGLPAQGRP
jgi:hypothetical protein